MTALLEIESLDPKGRRTVPNAIETLHARYAFSKFPKTLEEMDFQKGVTMGAGTLGDIAIDQIVFYHNGLVIDTRSSTQNATAILLDILQHSKSISGASVVPVRQLLTSQIIFVSDLKLPLVNPLLTPLAKRLSEIASRSFEQPLQFETINLSLGVDASQLKIAPSNFTIERRAERPFSENMYFSSAPLDTVEHIRIIEEVEKLLTP
ncbi:MAG: hypothetical protein M3O20_07720 [Acidobacteriota bacterium]|nr:hypothetical protein [Acidobacteriota bacterium]